MRLPGVIDIGNIKHTWKGEWDQGTVYFLNDVVKYHGQKFVCIDTELSDNRKYGEIYKPTVANEYWQPFSYGYLWRGGWNYRDEYYPGDVIKWNSDWYVCNTYNFGGHPVYENGGLTSKWTKIMSTGDENTNKRHNHLWFGNFEPMGWTRNMCSNGVELAYNALELTLYTINGNFEPSFMGRCDGYTGAGYLGGNYVSQQHSGNCDWWDFYDGYNSSITGGLPKCVQVLTGYYQTMYLYDNGEVYACGHNNYGYIGDGSSNNRYFNSKFGRLKVTTQITPVGNGRHTGVLRDVFIIKMASNMYNQEYLYNHTLLLDNQGRVWACGYNGYGQIGQGTDEAAAFYEPVQIPQKFFDNARIVDIWVSSTGSASNSYALDENGQLWAWGYNQYGCLGIGDYNNGNSSCVRPVKQPIDWTRYGGIKKVQFTGNSSNNAHGGVALTNDGSLWAWGGTWARAAAAFGEGTNRDYIYKPEKYKTLLWNRANTAGGINQTQLKQMGVTMDVVDSIDDFWVQGYGQADTLFMKERVTGSMFGLGYNSYNRLPFSRQQAIFDAGDWDANNPDAHVSYPTLLTLGNFTDIKYVAPQSMWAFQGTYWLGFHHLNRDGRIMSAGGPYDAVKGVGLNYRDTPLRSIRLPWEGDINQQATPTQVRGIDNASMITSMGQQNGSGVVLTQNNEIKIWGNFNVTYAILPSAGSDAHSPIRPNNFA